MKPSTCKYCHKEITQQDLKLRNALNFSSTFHKVEPHAHYECWINSNDFIPKDYQPKPEQPHHGPLYCNIPECVRCEQEHYGY